MSNTCRSYLQSRQELSSLSLSHDWGIQVYLTCGHLAALTTSRWVRCYATYPMRIPCNWVQKNNVIHPGILGFEQFFPMSVRENIRCTVNPNSLSLLTDQESLLADQKWSCYLRFKPLFSEYLLPLQNGQLQKRPSFKNCNYLCVWFARDQVVSATFPRNLVNRSQSGSLFAVHPAPPKWI